MFKDKRCSARMRIREEWSRLKETDNLVTTPDKFNNKNQRHPNTNERQNANCIPCIKNIIPVRSTRKLINNKPQTSDVLRGVVALVDVGSESRALALRAALTALGSSVVPKWSPLVTHLIWSQGGDRAIRAKARALACRLVSPLWVEACAASAKRLPEQSFPAAPRPSDLPSPRTLKQMLRANYSYDVFGGTKVLITNDAQQKDAAIQLLTICGAIAIDGARYQLGGQTQNGGPNPNGAKSQTGAKTQNKDGSDNQDGRNKSGDFDVKIGVAPGEAWNGEDKTCNRQLKSLDVSS
ncbi:hypothetical protein O3G_MSEX014471 [Manduca sexta]|uniref:BRCT domain-containing protein n=1 Tax=Manduca sexta TaxID=7130 RepID=A0A922D035_MANSE|nr:hypothetical protein O3G_MSEX014471 [Manduca sexta]